MNTLRRTGLVLVALLALLLAAVPAAAQDDDPDADGLTTDQEVELGTDPTKSDTDVDRLSDGFEVREFGTDPLRADSDEDGLGDGDELEVYKTDPLATDSDGDGVDDPTELDAGTDPNDDTSFPQAEEPTPTPAKEPVTALPNTGSGTSAQESGDRNWPLVAAVVAIAAASLVINRRRSA